MTQVSVAVQADSTKPPKIREITLDHPWQWIAAGWNDFKQAPKLSVAYGTIFFAVSILITMLVFSSRFFFLVPPLAAGFFLIAPIMGVFLYDTSRKLKAGESPSIGESCSACQRNPFNLSVMGVILLLALIFWMMIANLVFAIFFSDVVLTLDDMLGTLFLSGNSPAFLAAGILSGGLLAFGVFCMTAISIPMMVDREIDTLSAITASYRAVMKNPRPLMLWASLIVMFVCIGILSFYIGFIITMPVIGYASWHAYRDLVAAEEAETS